MARAKGTTLVGLVKFVRRHRAEAAGLLPAALRHYLEDRVVLASWYPEEDLLGLARAVACLMPPAAGDPWEVMGRVSARDHLEADGTYAHLLDGAQDPLAIPARAFALWASQHDSGKLETRIDGPASASVRLVEFAAPSREMCGIVGGYLAETLRLVGFAAPAAEKTACRADGAPACTWRCTWQAAPARPAESGATRLGSS
jgi:hypothetical protein